MVCSVCGFSNGSHGRECIQSLLVANNRSLASVINKLYPLLSDVGRKRILSFIEINETLDEVDDELELLRDNNRDYLAPAGKT